MNVDADCVEVEFATSCNLVVMVVKVRGRVHKVSSPGCCFIISAGTSVLSTYSQVEELRNGVKMREPLAPFGDAAPKGNFFFQASLKRTFSGTPNLRTTRRF